MLADIIRAVVMLTASLHPLADLHVAEAILLFLVSAYMFAVIYRHLERLRHARTVRIPPTMWIQTFLPGLVAVWIWVPGATG
jgi:hypothetical protein